MKRDFTLPVYKKLLESAMKAGYRGMAVEDYFLQDPGDQKVFVLRQDADRMPQNALRMATLQKELGLRSTFYFRVLESYDPDVMHAIVALGHELGYHYEDVSLAGGDIDKAYDMFCRNLELFRTYYPVKTICMHGSPMSRFDNRIIWTKYRYRDHGIIAEPYFDIDFSRVLYLTDTGRAWNNVRVSVRDRVKNNFDLRFRSTDEISRQFLSGKLPDRIMHNIHPHRWNDGYLLWTRELIFQNLKNTIKYFISRSSADPAV